MSKKSGSYYTPDALADFIAKYTGERCIVCNDQTLNVLEPSCGDGVFLKALNRHFSGINLKVDAIDLDSNAIEKVSLLLNELEGEYNLNNIDYLKWCSENEKKYDLIIGNPPYISKKLLNEEQKEACRTIHIKNSTFGTEIHNIWTSFLCDSMSRLNENGTIAFVLPAELLKVKFGEKIQRALLNEFQRIEVFTFSNNVFPNIEQDTIILFLFKNSDEPGLYFTTINSSKCLINNRFKLKRKRSLEAMKLKWSAYPLLEKHIDQVTKIKKQLAPILSYCDTIPGIVTAANDYFIASKSVVDEYQLQDISTPIIQKGVFVNGCVKLSQEKFNTLIERDKPAFFLDLAKADLDNEKHQNYINIGTERKIDQRYKCKLRDKWYEVPGAWIPEGFFFKRCHDYPKLIFNDANALVTDASYRIRMKEGYDIRSLIFSFYNSLTLALSEVQGRYYGGGVLELTPSEFQSLPIPYMQINENDFNEFVESFHNKQSIHEVLAHNDEILLINHLGMSRDDVESLRIVRKILMARRLNISKSQFS
ncbi:N-6 DNA methylase [Vibrio fluvialis]|nr:N-6 DNA methylase [Vibrio fluvialis]